MKGAGEPNLQDSDFDVKFYDEADGTKPAKDFALELPQR